MCARHEPFLAAGRLSQRFHEALNPEAHLIEVQALLQHTFLKLFFALTVRTSCCWLLPCVGEPPCFLAASARLLGTHDGPINLVRALPIALLC